MRAVRSKYLLPLIGVLAVLAIAFTTSPIYQPVPGPDSGVFLYVGQQILDGKVPYKDVWDHKPPAIHYINAFGLLISGGSRWGVWAIESSALLGATLLGFLVIKRAFGVIPAVFGSGTWLFSLPSTLGFGNEPEVYALPLQFGVLYFVQRAEEQHRHGRALLLAGVLTAICFLLKQTLVGIGLATVIVIAMNRLLTRDWKALSRQLSAFGIGAIGTLTAVGAYFWGQNAFKDLWNAAFIYNFNILETVDGPIELVRPIFEGLRTMAISGATQMALAGWLAGIAYLRFGKDQRVRSAPILRVSLVGLVVVILLTSGSGKAPAYYFIAWAPTIAILSGFLAYVLLTTNGSAYKAVPNTALVFALFGGMALVPGMQLLSDMRYVGGLGPLNPSIEVVNYVLGTTQPTDSVLLWGSAAAVNFMSERRSPARLVYQYPLWRGKPSATLAQEFISDIKTDKPLLIIDTSPTNLDVPPLDSPGLERWTLSRRPGNVSTELQEISDYVVTNYQLIEMVGQGHWPVYKYVGTN